MSDADPAAVAGPPPAGTAGTQVPGLAILSRTFQAFRYRDFRLIWFGAFMSTTGTWMQQVAESWVVLSLTGSAFYLGLTAFLGQLPFILFTLLGGVIADRIERRKLLLASQYAQMLTALVVTVLIYFEWIQVWHLLTAAFTVGTAQAFGGPAYQALIPALVKREDVPNAIALNSIQFNLARVFGPLLAGAALALVGPAMCFGLNGVSFLAVIVSLYLIRSGFKPQKPNASVLADLKRGLRYVTGNRALWQLCLLGSITTFCGFPLMTLLPVFAKDVFQMGSTGYSTMMTVSGSGSVVGALFYASLKTVPSRRGKLTLRLQLAYAVILLSFGLSRVLALSYLLLFAGGFCLMMLIASTSSLVQLAVSEEMRGRMMSIFMLAFRGGMPLGSLMAGYLAAQASPTTALTLMSLLLGTIAAGFLASRSPVKQL